MSSRRQTTGSVVCTSCGSLVGVRDEKCLQLRPPQSRAVGIRAAACEASATISASCRSSSGAAVRCTSSRCCSRAARCAWAADSSAFSRPTRVCCFCSALAAGFPSSVRPVVDGAERRLAARQSASHHLQHDVGARPRARPSPTCSAPAAWSSSTRSPEYAGFLLSSFAYAFLPHLPFLSGAGFTVGASASVFGFLGALVYYGRRTGSSLTRSEALRYALILGFFGFVMRGVDNFAHAGGFFGGYLAARFLDPLKARARRSHPDRAHLPRCHARSRSRRPL